MILFLCSINLNHLKHASKTTTTTKTKTKTKNQQHFPLTIILLNRDGSIEFSIKILEKKDRELKYLT